MIAMTFLTARSGRRHAADTIAALPGRLAGNRAAALLLSASLLLSGCSLLTPQPLSAESPMPALSSLEQTTTQRLSLRVESIEETGEADPLPPLLGVLKQSPQSMRLVLLSVQGQRLLTLVHDAQGSRFEKARPEVLETLPFTADWLARRITWSHWPRAALETAFKGTDWRLVQSGEWETPLQPAQRSILQGSENVATLTRDDQGQITLSDRSSDRQLILTPLTTSAGD